MEAPFRVRRRVSLRLGYWLCCLPWFVQLRRKEPGGDWSRRWNALGCGRETFWALVAQLAVRPVMVVLAAVVLHDYAGFGQRPELLPVEALVAQASMETLDEAILPRTAGLDIDRLDLVGGQPSLDFLGDKLGTIVTPQVRVSESLCVGS